jgi:hypothetical protein
MLIILLYDLPWYFASRGYTTKHLIKMWAFINFATCILVIATYFSAIALKTSEGIAEGIAFIPVIFLSLIDIAEVILRRRIIADFLRGLIEGHSPSPSDIR